MGRLGTCISRLAALFFCAMLATGVFCISCWTPVVDQATCELDIRHAIVTSDEASDPNWNTTYGWQFDEAAAAIVGCNNGGYLLVGGTQGIDGGDWDAWIVLGFLRRS